MNTTTAHTPRGHRAWLAALTRPTRHPNGTCARCGIAVPDDTNICDDCAAYWAVR